MQKFSLTELKEIAIDIVKKDSKLDDAAKKSKIDQISSATSKDQLVNYMKDWGYYDLFLRELQRIEQEQKAGFLSVPHGGGASPSVTAQLGLVREEQRKRVRGTTAKAIAEAQAGQANVKEGIEKTSKETKTIAINKSIKVPKRQQTEAPSEEYGRGG